MADDSAQLYRNRHSSAAKRPAVADDIVTRLQCIYNPDGCGQCTFCLAKAEIERLRAQVAHAHAILASEGAAWLMVGSNHEQSWRQSLTPAIELYWRKYGNYFKEARRG